MSLRVCAMVRVCMSPLHQRILILLWTNGPSMQRRTCISFTSVAPLATISQYLALYCIGKSFHHDRKQVPQFDIKISSYGLPNIGPVRPNASRSGFNGGYVAEFRTMNVVYAIDMMKRSENAFWAESLYVEIWSMKPFIKMREHALNVLKYHLLCKDPLDATIL